MAVKVPDPKPLIGVTGPDHGGRTAWHFTRFALRRAGARVYRLTPSCPSSPELLNGLIIGGGDDIDPRRYGEVSRITTRIDRQRDQLEWDMLALAQQQNLPILGICRGAQLLNIFHGGNLHQDLLAAFENLILRRSILPRKRILVTPGTQLAMITGAVEIKVNSLHHQAVDQLADGFRMAAKDQDGIIQAIEAIDHPFRIGVQWHPEYIPQSRTQRRIFKTLVAAAQQEAEAVDSSTEESCSKS